MGAPFACSRPARPGQETGSRVPSKDSRSPTGGEEARRNGPEPVEGPESFLMSAWFYILRLQSGSLYPGATADLKQRYEEHSTKRACRTTTLDPPIALAYSEEYETFSEARRREAQVKRWSRAKKEALVLGNLSSLRNLSKSK